MNGFVIPDFHRIRRDVDRLERLLDLLDESEHLEDASSQDPSVAHWYRPSVGGPRIFRSAVARDGPTVGVFAVEVACRRMHDGIRFWRLGAPSPTNDNTGEVAER